MALLFNQFGVREVELDMLMWPGFGHGFHAGELSALYSKLNTDDVFESCNLQANVGAQFESEHWRYDISTTRIQIEAEAFASFEELDHRVMHLLTETQNHFTPRRLRYLWADRAKVWGVVPQDASKDIGDVLLSKLLARRISTTRDGGERLIDGFPGVLGGAGLTLTGDTADDCHWHANIGPVHGGATELRLSAELYFPPPTDAPEHSMISDRLRMAYDFVKDNVVAFAQGALG